MALLSVRRLSRGARNAGGSSSHEPSPSTRGREPTAPNPSAAEATANSRRRAGLSVTREEAAAACLPCTSDAPTLVGVGVVRYARAVRVLPVTGRSRRARSTRSRAEASGSSAVVGAGRVVMLWVWVLWVLWVLWAGISHATAARPAATGVDDADTDEFRSSGLSSIGSSSMLISSEPLRERVPLGPRTCEESTERSSVQWGCLCVKRAEFSSVGCLCVKPAEFSSVGCLCEAS